MKKLLLKVIYVVLFMLSVVLWLAVSGIFIRFDTTRATSFQELYDQGRLGQQIFLKMFNATGLYYEQYCFLGVRQTYIYGKLDQSTVQFLKDPKQWPDLSYSSTRNVFDISSVETETIPGDVFASLGIGFGEDRGKKSGYFINSDLTVPKYLDYWIAYNPCPFMIHLNPATGAFVMQISQGR